MARTRVTGVYLVASILALVVASSVSAQGAAGGDKAAPRPSDQTAQQPSVLEATAPANAFQDIVVTARRREEALQSVPVAITALSGDALASRGIQTVDRLRDLAPSVNVGGQKRDEAQFYIRGQGPGVINAGQRNFSSVATYFAEVPIPIAGPGVFFDLQSVQVLKGPQGTLFGRNTTGGAVLFEPSRPTDEAEGYVQLSAGNYDRKGFESVINVPFGHDLGGIRVAAQVERRDGFTRNITTGQRLDGRRFESFRASLLLKPFNGFENLTIVDYTNRDQSGSAQILRAVNGEATLAGLPTDPALAPLLGLAPGGSITLPIRVGGSVSIACAQFTLPGCPTGQFGGAVAAFQAAARPRADGQPTGFFLIASNTDLAAILAQQQALGVRRIASPTRTRAESLAWGITNRTTWEISDHITLKNIFAYRGQRTDEGNEYDGSSLELFRILNASDRLPPVPSSRYPARQWQFGQDQVTEEFQVQGRLGEKLNYIMGLFYERSYPAFTPRLDFLAFGTPGRYIITNKDISKAVFAHAEYDVTDTINVSGGYRHTWDERDASIVFTNPSVGPDPNGACTLSFALACPTAYEAKFKASTYDGTVNWKAFDGALLYVAYRRGFKSGGFNLPAPTVEDQSFGPEKVDNYEFGAKIDWDIGVPFRTNVALFLDKFKDVQVTVPVAVQGTIASLARNLGRQTNKGAELEALIVPVSNFRLSGFVSYLQAESDVTIPGTPAVEGRQVVYQPKWKYNITGRYAVPLNEGSEISLQADYSYQGRTRSPDLAAPPPSNQFDSFGVANARLEWSKVGGRNIDLSAFVNNALNKKYIIGGYPLLTSLGIESVIYGEPRTYGASIRVHWGK